MNPEETLKRLPLVPLRGTVLFPHIMVPVSVGRAGSRAAVEAALASEEKEVLVVAQTDIRTEHPGRDDIHRVATLAQIKKVARSKDGTVQVLLQGLERVALIRVDEAGDHLAASYRPLPVEEQSGVEIEALGRETQELIGEVIAHSRADLRGSLEEIVAETRYGLRTLYLFASMVGLSTAQEQEILAAPTLRDGLTLLHTFLSHELKVLRIRKEIAESARTEIDREQREYLLRQQLEAIREELGEKGSEQTEFNELRQRLEKAELPESVRQEAERELNRLEKIPAASPEHGVTRTYLEFLLELPWSRASADHLDLAEARRILDEDHYGLKEIKERILEHLGVLKLNRSARPPILCFVGPPGVGKTSLGRSIARALHREFERMSLGGMHDEAELRGHRRTYVGAMPGRILQALRRVKVRNPVLLLDEIDKLGYDFRGDPASALLEILDPEQNREFRDNYLDLPFDLSGVLFVTTANTLESIPGALRDRMEVIRLEGYSDEEKVAIARQYLIPRQREEKGLREEQLGLDDAVVQRVIRGYTREAGVRQLWRLVGKLARKAALRIAEGGVDAVTIDERTLDEFLGPEKFFLDQARSELTPGVATGLAWTPTGGEVLYIEASLLPQGSGLTLTGQLGSVMQESGKTAQSYIWSHAAELGIDPALFKDHGVHIHAPAGAIPKDGPSAGITIAAALASVYTGRTLRGDTAMTGEITLSGLVLPVGGIKEKVLAARRAGLKRVVLSRENAKDLRDLPEEVRAELEFVLVEKLSEVLDVVFDAEGAARWKRVG